MIYLDYIVLVAYFVLMSGIGLWTMRRIKVQEDFFMGGRGFGKLLQTFAAFGAGTGSADPVNTASKTYKDGASGMWSVMYWLFVTPFYWIAAVWYRRMRHTTLGDWFVERYESQAIGAAYAVFGVLFYIVYGAMMFSAIGKVAAPLVGFDHVVIGSQSIALEYLLVPIIGIVVLIYAIAGGLHAAYWTDLVQGLCVLLLSVLLVPFGLWELVEQFGDPTTQGMGDGFRILHERLPADKFDLIGGAGAEFTLLFLVGVVLMNLIGIVVQPHFIATGGGSAKTEKDARVGLVVGNFLKRFCTIGWLLTALIVLALYANDPLLSGEDGDPDKAWGIASQRLLGPGLAGLMLACLLAALMSSVSAYMVVGSALIVRNIYAPFINPNAGEREYVRLARLTGVLIVGGAVVFSMLKMNVFALLKQTWDVGLVFGAPFWIGMYWRRATTTAAWASIAFSFVAILIPSFFWQNYGLSADWKVTVTFMKVFVPFGVMIVVSLLTKKNSKHALDRYYAKMKTPVLADRDEDHRRLEEVFADPAQTEHKKLFPGSSLEFNQPTATDIVGFLACVAACFGIIGLAYWAVNIGG